MVGNPTQGRALDNHHGTGAGCSEGFNLESELVGRFSAWRQFAAIRAVSNRQQGGKRRG
jgi:hypothetical protein